MSWVVTLQKPKFFIFMAYTSPLSVSFVVHFWQFKDKLPQITTVRPRGLHTFTGVIFIGN